MLGMKELATRTSELSGALGVASVLKDKGLITDQDLNLMVQRSITILKGYEMIQAATGNLIRNRLRQCSDAHAAIANAAGRGDVSDEEARERMTKAAQEIDNCVQLEQKLSEYAAEYSNKMLEDFENDLARQKQALKLEKTSENDELVKAVVDAGDGIVN